MLNLLEFIRILCENKDENIHRYAEGENDRAREEDKQRKRVCERDREKKMFWKLKYSVRDTQ